MQFHSNELFLFYNPQTTTGKQTKALALDICSHINEIDSVREKMSAMYWKEIVDMLGIQPNDLLDHSDEDSKNQSARQWIHHEWLAGCSIPLSTPRESTHCHLPRQGGTLFNPDRHHEIGWCGIARRQSPSTPEEISLKFQLAILLSFSSALSYL